MLPSRIPVLYWDTSTAVPKAGIETVPRKVAWPVCCAIGRRATSDPPACSQVDAFLVSSISVQRALYGLRGHPDRRLLPALFDIDRQRNAPSGSALSRTAQPPPPEQELDELTEEFVQAAQELSPG
jgi:hypothetical protein